MNGLRTDPVRTLVTMPYSLILYCEYPSTFRFPLRVEGSLIAIFNSLCEKIVYSISNDGGV